MAGVPTKGLVAVALLQQGSGPAISPAVPHLCLHEIQLKPESHQHR